MPRAVVVGGGWAGCAAALAAKNQGADTLLLERADTLLGSGQVGGIMRNNGRFTAAEEMIALGGGELFKLADENARHVNIEFPGHAHANLYDVRLMEPMVRRYLEEKEVEIWTVSRATEVETADGRIEAVRLETGQLFEGDVFIDTTGGMGPQGNCRKYGNGCAMCVMRCPTFGGRVSIAACAGIAETRARRQDDKYGSMSGACKLNKESLDHRIVQELERIGVAIIPTPKDLAPKEEKLQKTRSRRRYAVKDSAENIVLLDTGHIALMTPFYPLIELRKIQGFKNAQYVDPYAGGTGNSIRFLAMAPRDNTLKVEGLVNLFCAGEKAGLLVGHTEAIVTGTLAGYNAVRYAQGQKPLELPRSTAVGEFIAYSREEMQVEEGMYQKLTFSGSIFFLRMRELALYTTGIEEIGRRVAQAGLSGVFAP